LSRWRLMVHEPSHGAWNMGVDEALLASAVKTGNPTLRFYRWQGPWLSLGYGQTLDRERLDACERAGVGVVRRVTGGRAVLHGGDLTYALAAREDQLPAGLTASYEIVAEVLIAALQTLGVEAVASPAPDRGAPRARFQTDPRRPVGRALAADFDCFANPAGREICAGGRKLAGSAQRRTQGGILQHGSIRLIPDPLEARRASSVGGAGATSLMELGADPDPEILLAACAEAFEPVLGGLEVAALSAEERADADERVRNHRSDQRFVAPIGTATASRQPPADR